MNKKRLPHKAAIATLLASALAGCSTLPATRVSVPGQGSMAFSVAGQGGTTVVLQSGLGDGKDAWQRVFLPLARNGTVFIYDRPGYGDTPATKAPRDPCTVAEEERRLLQAAGMKPPYILVGHSIGGLYQYAFASLYPKEVAGVVLLDPTHPRHWERMQKDAPVQASALKGISALSLDSAMKHEFDAQAVCTERLMQAGRLQVPARLLVSGKMPTLATPGFRSMMDDLRQDWLRLSGAPRIETQTQSGHYLQDEAPEAVIAAVNALRDGAQTASHLHPAR